MFSIVSFQQILIAIVLAFIFCALAFYKKWLTRSGSVAAFFIAIIIWMAGSWRMTLPMVVFFIAGSLSSKLPSRAIVKDIKNKKARDHLQVICNGGVAAVFAFVYLVHNNHSILIAYYTSIAVSISDTISSEAGNFFNGEVVDIKSFKRIDKGLSGGISLQGTIAGLSGAFLIGILYYFCIGTNIDTVLFIAGFGFGGMLVDSLLGSLVQSKFITNENKIIEERVNNSRIIRGYRWMSNDIVNIISNAIISLLILAQQMLT